VIYLTGDVHWGRIVEGKNAKGKVLFYEVIASPSRLVATIGADQLSSLRNLFKRQPFPRHSEAAAVPSDFKLADLTFDIKHRQKGDHIAMLQFQQCPGMLEFNVQYVCTDADARIRQQHSNSYGPYKLLSPH
jgi:hypothetical protein